MGGYSIRGGQDAAARSASVRRPCVRREAVGLRRSEPEPALSSLRRWPNPITDLNRSTAFRSLRIARRLRTKPLSVSVVTAKPFASRSRRRGEMLAGLLVSRRGEMWKTSHPEGRRDATSHTPADGDPKTRKKKAIFGRRGSGGVRWNRFRTTTPSAFCSPSPSSLALLS
jgi:hypothetical protein